MFPRRSGIWLVFALTLLASCFDRAASAAPTARYFPETGFSVAGEFLEFWRSTPRALYILGYPISQPFLQESATAPGTYLRVQYFERAILEEHPTADRRVLIQGRLLGNDLAAARRHELPFQPVARPNGKIAWDSVTRHTLSDRPAPFKRFYDQFGGLRVFGRPISEQFEERNPDTGAIRWVQYFERQRMEWHPDQRDPQYQVLLGRLGAEYQRAYAHQLDPGAFLRRTANYAVTERFRYGINATLYYTDRDRALKLVSDAGFGWVRQQVHWKDHQRADGTILWGELDAIVAAAQAQGPKLLLAVTHAPDWATGLPGVAGLPDRAHLPDYARFLGALAERYRGHVHAYQIWNEINLATENGVQPIPAPAYYVEMLSLASTAIRAADPDALVISSSLAPTEWAGDPDVAVSDLAYFRQLFADPRFWLHIDAVGVHVFGCANPPESFWPDAPGPGPGWNDSREFYFRRVEDVRRLMVERGYGDRQIWITEFGWTTANTTPGHEFGQFVDPQEQAAYLVRALEMGRDDYAPWLGAMFVWNLNFAVAWQAAGDPLHQMAGYSILNGDWSPRPAYEALRAMPKH